jgi:hypothetical protein
MPKITKTKTAKTKTAKTKTSKKTVVEDAPVINVDINDVDTQDTSDVDGPQEIALTKFKKLFKDEIKETAAWLKREDKEKDFPDNKSIKEAALRMTIDNHPEYVVSE